MKIKELEKVIRDKNTNTKYEAEMGKLHVEREATKAVHKEEMVKMNTEHDVKMAEMDAKHEARMAKLRAEREAIETEFASIRDQVLQARTTEDLESAYLDFMLVTKKHLNKKRD